MGQNRTWILGRGKRLKKDRRAASMYSNNNNNNNNNHLFLQYSGRREKKKKKTSIENKKIENYKSFYVFSFTIYPCLVFGCQTDLLLLVLLFLSTNVLVVSGQVLFLC